MNEAIRLEGLGKRFGSLWAVRQLSLTVPSGAIHAFLGPNGAGKTTTLKLIAGLLFPTEGTVRIGNMDPSRDWEPVRRMLSYVPDVPFLYGKLTGEEFLGFVGGLHGMDGGSLVARIDLFVERFGLQQYHRRRVESYSHGTRQKYVISAALLSHPRVLLVDEPMVGLDPASSRILKDLLREEADGGACVLLSTHTLSVAQELADRITVINRGSLVLSGTTSELLGHDRARSLEDLFLEITQPT
ncbi:MAG: ABC transporter ATP-binding protein [Candidatus Eisenbacteria bacterium]|nr:ABC transporter ATP-binding protein [Candidatus Eisenbacteria bacterium]